MGNEMYRARRPRVYVVMWWYTQCGIHGVARLSMLPNVASKQNKHKRMYIFSRMTV